MQDFASPNTVSPKILEAMESGSESRMSTSINVSLSADIKPATVEENLQVSIHRLFYLIKIFARILFKVYFIYFTVMDHIIVGPT